MRDRHCEIHLSTCMRGAGYKEAVCAQDQLRICLLILRDCAVAREAQRVSERWRGFQRGVSDPALSLGDKWFLTSPSPLLP